jgi:hypothetical protein
MIGSSLPLPGVGASQRVQSATASSSEFVPSARAGRSNVLTNLSSDDRALLQEALGVRLTAEGVDEKNRALAPAVAFLIAHDRQRGTLPEGQPITATYLHNLLKDQTSSGGAPQDVIDSINKMLDAVAKRGAQERFDLRT